MPIFRFVRVQKSFPYFGMGVADAVPESVEAQNFDEARKLVAKISVERGIVTKMIVDDPDAN